MHTRLAKALIDQGDFKKAENVLDRVSSLFDPAVIPTIQTYNIPFTFQSMEVVKLYFKIPTPSASEKGLKLASHFIDDLKESFDWVEKCDDRTLQIQNENIYYFTVFLNEILNNLTPDQIKTLQPKLAQIKTISISKKMMPQLSKDAASTIKKFYTAEGDSFGVLQREIYKILSTMTNWENILNAQNEIQNGEIFRVEIERHLAALAGIDPRLRTSIEYAIYPEREIKDTTTKAIQ